MPKKTIYIVNTTSIEKADDTRWKIKNHATNAKKALIFLRSPYAKNPKNPCARNAASRKVAA